MRLPLSRGPISDQIFTALRRPAGSKVDVGCTAPACTASEILADEDVQISLWVLYELHHAGFDDADDRWEFSPELLRVRATLEASFEGALRDAASEVEVGAGIDVAERLFATVAGCDGPSVSRFVRNHASRDQVTELLIHRSIYTLKEADLHTWVIPRLRGAPKVRLVELQYDEYGAGVAERQHAAMFAGSLRACDLSDAYGAYIESVPAMTLAVNNMMALFGLHRRLRGAAVGHLAAFEATSSLPARDIAAGLERVGLQDAAPYFLEHVEADAVHEQVAMRDICAALVEAQPDLLEDVLFGVRTCLALDNMWATSILDRWRGGESSLRSEDVALDHWLAG